MNFAFSQSHSNQLKSRLVSVVDTLLVVQKIFYDDERRYRSCFVNSFNEIRAVNALVQQQMPFDSTGGSGRVIKSGSKRNTSTITPKEVSRLRLILGTEMPSIGTFETCGVWWCYKFSLYVCRKHRGLLNTPGDISALTLRLMGFAVWHLNGCARGVTPPPTFSQL